MRAGRLLSLLVLALGACAATAPGDSAAEFAALRELEQRVAAVAYRLSIANAELCPDKGPQTGLTLHNAAQYGPAIRTDAMRYFGLTEAPGVLAVAPGSAAERAGLKLDDAIVATGGAALAAPSDSPASYDPLERAWGQLERDLRQGPAALVIQRGGAQLPLTLEAVQGCAYRVQLVPSSSMTASADGRVVSLSTALVRYAARDEDLAVIMGHELAHNVLQHRAHPTGSARSREREADYVGLYLAARAGYDISGAGDFWRRFGADDWRARLGVFTHPSPTARSRALVAAAVEIEAKRASGEALLPAP